MPQKTDNKIKKCKLSIKLYVNKTSMLTSSNRTNSNVVKITTLLCYQVFKFNHKSSTGFMHSLG